MKTEEPRSRSFDEDVSNLLGRGFLSMAFQPIVETRTSKNIGYEALLRGPKGTPLASPGLLFGKPDTLSGEVLRQLDLACVESALRSGRPLPKDTKLFINVHGGTMYMDGQELFSLMDALEVDPTRVVLEVSETIDAAHVKAISKFLVPFRKRGVQVALDDVGVRYAWLYHLLYLEPEYFKIDRAFVKNVHRIPRKAQILLGLRGLAEHVGASLIAEGIETEEDGRALSELGIAYGQGFWLGTPKPAEEWLDGSDRKNLWRKRVDAVHIRH
jgi:EAL domain-containing protein (putative c-di-GMP-specific phosphodiesterase class I)